MIINADYTVDCFYHVPYIIEDTAKFSRAQKHFIKDLPEKARVFLEEMNYRFEYECDKTLSGKVARGYIGELILRCESDSDEHEKEVAECKMMAFINYNELAGLADLCLISLGEEIPIHFITEEFYRGNGTFVFDEKVIPVDEYILHKFGLERCGNVKGLVALDRYPKDINEIVYLTAAEEYGTQDVDSCLKANPRLALKDISQYEAIDLYVNEPMAVCVFKESELDYRDRLYEETIILQIIECMVFKITAINRTNRSVVEVLEENGNPPIKFIEDLNVQFARTIRFWDTSNFVYLTTRNVAYEIADGFKVDELMESYSRNQDFLEHLINIRGAQAEEKESTLLNILAIVLTVVQCLPVFYDVVSLALSGELTLSHFMNALGALGCTSVIILIFIGLLKKGKVNKKRKNLK